MVARLRPMDRAFRSSRRWPVAVMGIVALAALGYYGAFYILGGSPRFCLSCHYMKPYYEQWQASTHKDVTCVRCHPINPGFITTTTVRYWLGAHNPRPRAEVKDTSCLQGDCHDQRLLNGKERLSNGIIFDHKEHVTQLRRGEKLHCSSCHNQIVQGGHINVDKRVCFLCHFKGAAAGEAATGCPSCHVEPTRVVFPRRIHLQSHVVPEDRRGM